MMEYTSPQVITMKTLELRLLDNWTSVEIVDGVNNRMLVWAQTLLGAHSHGNINKHRLYTAIGK